MDTNETDPIPETETVKEEPAKVKKPKAKKAKTLEEPAAVEETGVEPIKPDPDFKSLTDVQECVDCYNEMTLVAADLGLKTVTVKSFADVKTGVLACERLHAQIKSTREEKKMGKAAKKVTKTKTKAVKGKKTAPKKAAPKTAAKKTVKAKSNGHSKTQVVAGLLTRKSGCTSAEVRAATGWPAVSMPAMAKAAGLKLRKEKEKGSVTRYFGG